MDTKICVAAYVDGIDILGEGNLLPTNDITSYSSHSHGLISDYGGSVNIQNWITNDGTNPQLRFSLQEIALVKNYIPNVDPTEKKHYTFVCVEKR
jgi:hypothetical protein